MFVCVFARLVEYVFDSLSGSTFVCFGCIFLKMFSTVLFCMFACTLVCPVACMFA